MLQTMASESFSSLLSQALETCKNTGSPVALAEAEQMLENLRRSCSEAPPCSQDRVVLDVMVVTMQKIIVIMQSSAQH